MSWNTSPFGQGGVRPSKGPKYVSLAVRALFSLAAIIITKYHHHHHHHHHHHRLNSLGCWLLLPQFIIIFSLSCKFVCWAKILWRREMQNRSRRSDTRKIHPHQNSPLVCFVHRNPRSFSSHALSHPPPSSKPSTAH